MIPSNIDKSWTLFLDRDGVINEKRENDYVKNWHEFSFIGGSLQAISSLSKVFGRIIIVTNQRGVGKGKMSENELLHIHQKMVEEIQINSGRIDKIYYCTDVEDISECRKPNTEMGFQALRDFPEINFEKSIIVGDSVSDIEFGQRLGMIKVFIGQGNFNFDLDGAFPSLYEFSLKFIS
jgi:histidinol-phosphate phosphatase family protein